jgi:hypothetical protein
MGELVWRTGSARRTDKREREVPRELARALDADKLAA